MKEKKGAAAEKPAASSPDILAIIATDEHAGRGGSYVLDLATGKRAKVETETETETKD